MSNQLVVNFEAFREQWLVDITSGKPSTVELGRRFAYKLIQQWRDADDSVSDLVYCDGAGDGGIDLAFLDLGDDEGEGSGAGHTWYLIQSKYGAAFQGVQTLLIEGQKVIDTLDGKRSRLSSLAEGLLEQLQNFRKGASENDQIVLLFATERALDDAQRRALDDLRAMGRGRLGRLFEVESISIETVHQRTLDDAAASSLEHRTVPFRASLVQSGTNLLVGSTSLTDLYEFLKSFRAKTDDLDQLYEKNVRRFLGGRGRVNRAMQETLRNAPEQFGLYNNGITVVVTDFELKGDGVYSLVEPYIVNGCQTTRTIWDVCHARLGAGNTGTNDEVRAWEARASNGVVVTKIVKVGDNGEELLSAITRYTNSQNAVKEKDFITLTSDFKTWARQMATGYRVFLEVQRGGWDSHRAYHRQHPEAPTYHRMANAFDLMKVYGAGWLGEAGLAYGKNPPFLPNGTIFKRITNQDASTEGAQFNVEDLYAALCLKEATDKFGFGRQAKEDSRRQTRFLYYLIVLDLLREVLTRGGLPFDQHSLSLALIKLFANESSVAKDALLNTALEALDSYMTQGSDNSVFDEPAYRNSFFFNLNGYLKWEKLGKSEADSPRLRQQLALSKMFMGQKMGGHAAPRDLILAVVR